ncbi:tetratricopeptide repeat protein [Jiangella rhizosphaerae]|uniref:Tetratricopeptide repeat protein n=1 Tax=Jiangella rhizosphaerae TaxID=2293569 RepID=A0A418KSI5_9ACTN|nr:hypothetical protein [Jiangella rhizosphaerae]RIQ27359.1 hypothetical protein DY240_09515 [Jiangella rhizosphaerae]
MARPPLTDRMLDRAEASLGDRPAALAQQFEDWAADPQPDDVENAGSLLAYASEAWLRAGEHDRALDTARRAVDSGDDIPPDPRCYLVDALLGAGRREEADVVAGDLRRSRGDDTFVLAFLGESYELHGDLNRAHRWFTMGLTAAERHGDPTGAVPTLLASRFRVRRELELPVDALDEEYTDAVVDDLEADGVDVAAEAAALMEEDGSNPDAFFRP